jgi:P-type conjugative transfer protein TrbG
MMTLRRAATVLAAMPALLAAQAQPSPAPATAPPPSPSAAARGAAGAPPDVEALARAYRESGTAPAVEGAAWSLWPYGHARPVLRCAPLRASVIELEAAETILSTATGDSERWLIQPATSGAGGRTPILVVKPTGCDLSTNLVVATDRRIYEIELDSPPCKRGDSGKVANPRLPYTALLRFYYPDDLVRTWAATEGAASAGAAAAPAAGNGAKDGVALSPTARLAALNFNYAWRRDRRYPWTPAQVFDDGEHTYIVLPPGARFEELPALFALQADGSPALLNYRVENGTFIADRVLRRAALVVGAGRKRDEQRLEITNRAGEKR